MGARATRKRQLPNEAPEKIGSTPAKSTPAKQLPARLRKNVLDAKGVPKRLTLKDCSPEVVTRIAEFLYNPPDMKDFTNFRKFFNRLAEAVLYSVVDGKVANTLAYIGSNVLLGLDREHKIGLGSSLEEQFNNLMGRASISMTEEQAKILLQTEDLPTQLKVLEAIVRAKDGASAIVTDAEIVGEPPPAVKHALGLAAKAKKLDETDYAL